MKQYEFDKIVTNKVKEYMDKGYHIHLRSFGGSDGTERVDLVNDNMHFVRIYVNEETGDGYGSIPARKYLLCVGEKQLSEDEMWASTIWSDNLTPVFCEAYYDISCRSIPWYVGQDEFDRVSARKAERVALGHNAYRSDRWGKNTFTNSLKSADAFKVAHSIMSRKPKCKSIRRSEIVKISKIINYSCMDGTVSVDWVIVTKRNVDLHLCGCHRPAVTDELRKQW